MASLTLKASIPAIRLVPGMELRLEAVDAADGSAVTGVTATRWAIYGDDEGGSNIVGESGPFMLVPGPGAPLPGGSSSGGSSSGGSGSSTPPVGNPGDGASGGGGAGAYPGIH